MSVFRPVPRFFGNSQENMHCGPACWRMILETYTPEKQWPFDEIDQIICKEPGKYTWGETFYPTMLEYGYRIHNISTWDHQQFIGRRWEYMRDRMGHEATEDQIKYAPDIGFVIKSYSQILNHSHWSKEKRSATLGDIRHHLEKGAYVIVLVNGAEISGREGLEAHFVLIYGVDDDHVYLQNPGLPPMPEQKVPVDLFLKTWNFGNAENYALTAFYNKS
jgi:hypothetical protein